MNAINLATTVILVAAVTLIGLCVIAPMVVQDGVNEASGNGDSALNNISESLNNLNDEAEDSALGEWLNNLDEVNK